MIVHPHFLDHWKVRALSERLGCRLAAVQCLLRLWGHCQERREWVFDLDAWRLAAICRDWTGPAEVLWSALTDGKIRVLDDVGDGRWEVHEWAQENASLTSAWSKGAKGGRKSVYNRRLVKAGLEAGVQPIGLDRIGQDRSLAGSSSGSTRSPEEWAHVLHGLFGRRDAEMECKEVIASDIGAGEDPGLMERNVRLIVGFIEGRAPGGWANAFIGSGKRFWMDRKWRNPEAFAQRWDDAKKNKGAGDDGLVPPVVPVTEEPAGWRVVWPELFDFPPPVRWLDVAVTDRRALHVAALACQKRKGGEGEP